MMFDKEDLILKIISAEALLYEVALQAPKFVGVAIQTFASQQVADIYACKRDAAEMAREFLEWIYNGAEKPDWVRK